MSAVDSIKQGLIEAVTHAKGKKARVVEYRAEPLDWRPCAAA